MFGFGKKKKKITSVTEEVLMDNKVIASGKMNFSFGPEENLNFDPGKLLAEMVLAKALGDLDKTAEMAAQLNAVGYNITIGDNDVILADKRED